MQNSVLFLIVKSWHNFECQNNDSDNSNLFTKWIFCNIKPPSNGLIGAENLI